MASSQHYEPDQTDAETSFLKRNQKWFELIWFITLVISIALIIIFAR